MSRSRSLRRARGQVAAGRQLVRAVVDDPKLARDLVRGRVGRGAPAPARTGNHQPPAWLDEFAAVASVSRELPVPVEAVRDLVGDMSRFPEWLSMHAGFRGDPPAEAVPGAGFVQQARIMGIPADVKWTVDEVTDLTVTLRGLAPMGVRLGFALEVEPSPTGCTLHFDAAIDGQPVRGPLGASILRSLNEELGTSLETLEGLLSSGAGARPVLHRASGTTIPGTTPVLVGVGQVVQREPNLAPDADPVGLAVRALHRAAADAGNPGLLADADTVLAVPSASWQYADAAALAAERVGATPERTIASSTFGGDGGQLVINHAAQLITDGEASVALLIGAEAGASLAASGNVTPSWPVQPAEVSPTEVIGVDRQANNSAETAVGLGAPIFMYSLMESAVRGKLGEKPAQHRQKVGRLWSRLSEVASGNPYAWTPTAYTPEQLVEPSADNRMVSEPYTKLLCANLQVDLATGMIMCSAAAAEAAGIPQEKWVFVHAGASGHDEWFVSERADMAASPTIRALGAAALDHAGITVDDLGPVDLYSCFPSAVQIAARELGLPDDDPERPLSVTGGLTFAGGPGNNYGGHAVATMVPLLRADPTAYGLSTSLGWYSTKHALGIYSAQPPAQPFRHLKPLYDEPPARRALTSYDGEVVVEAFTVPYDRDGAPEAVIVSAITPEGNRLLLRSSEADLVEALLGSDPLGWTLAVTAEGGVSIRSKRRSKLPDPPAPPVLVEQQGPVTIITLNRPEVRNAFDARTAALMERAIDRFEADPDARVAVITGAGNAFSAGMDLKAAARGELPYGETRGPLGISERPPTKPVIAAVNGPALAGGCELALCADLIVAAEDSVFGIPEPKRGLVAAAGGVMRLAERLPRNIAMELALTGDPMPATRMAELGLVNELAPAEKVLEAALDLAGRIAVNAPLSVELSKRIVLESGDGTSEEAFQRQTELATPALVSQDAAEGVAAFAEKREPVWKGC
jgi:acetyl-CoA C-acetyltransferase